MTHGAMKPEDRLEAGLNDGLVRLSEGCEGIEDLLADFKRVLGGLL